MPEELRPTPSAPASVAPAGTPSTSGLLSLAVGVVVVAALYLAREVLVPITLAVLLSFVLAPLVSLLRRMRFPNVLAVLMAVVVGLGVLGALGGVIGIQVASLAPNLPGYVATIEGKVQTVQAATVGRLTSLAERVGRHVEPAPTPANPDAASSGRLGRASDQPVPVTIQEEDNNQVELLRRIAEPVLAPVETTLIIFIVAVFILLQREDLRDRLIRLFGSGDLHRTTIALDEAARRLSRYFLAQLGINAAFGVVVAIGLTIIGIPSPILWGILGALLRFVPYVGAIIAAALPVALAAAVDPNWSLVIWTAGLFVVCEALTGQVVEPLVYGHSTGLSPVAVVVAAIFWTWLWGPIGLILSTPLTLCLVILGRYVDRLEFLDVLLGDRPALTPVENFYQRMLADDPDEAQEQAELLLKQRSLTGYYDEVALKGLQLAANDAQRGVLGQEKLERIKRSIRSLVHELADYDDVEPAPDERAEAAAGSSKSEKDVEANSPPEHPPERAARAPGWDGATPIMCLAGRGPLDEAASTILAQLLDKHGLGARVIPHEAASREGIATLDPAGIVLICISYLEISGNPAHLRYLIGRLRKRFPKIAILVGLWPAEAEVLRDEQMRKAIGSDYYTTSLREAVETCLKAATSTAPGSSTSVHRAA
ncbi:AI-2E family transporter [Aureimonas leprariae]|uniref:AI-2E family transporter n=1 Tax=Plantimonas leprariae TaxID=2615207 RepID=A0A7V7TUE3_9HYPH|nr:AI-2E family transporter [Aureimonas leprariae]KAB0676189.1 AI-2E family transporter [Aureimonas leprariae]